VAIDGTDKPEYRNRYPCPTCNTGYLDCMSYFTVGLVCCSSCIHPGRFETQTPYTKEELLDMQQRYDNGYDR